MSIIMTILGMIPGLSSLAQSFITAFYNSKVMITTAKIGGDTAVATALIKAESTDYATNVDRLKVIASSKVLMFLIVGFAFPWIIMEWKVIVWDTILGWGVTAPIRGTIGDWGGLIISCLFGAGTAMHVGGLYFNRKD